MSIRTEWIRTVAPQSEPLSLGEAKLHAVVHQADDDVLLRLYLTAGREAGEADLQRGFVTQTWQLELSDFADEMRLPMAAPLQSVASIAYYNDAGTLTMLPTTYYSVDTTATPGLVLRKPNQVWPSLQSDRLMRVVITYVCGWEDVADIPALVKHGIQLYAAWANADRLGVDAKASRDAAYALWALVGRATWRPPCQS